jgi:hypothetical protein
MTPLAKVFTVTKNEYDLIEDFLRYHGALFGYDNVVVIDNGSTDPHVLDVYQRYIPKGVTVVTRTGYRRDQQGEHFTEIMRQYKQSAEFLIGLDTDCFFSVRDSCDPTVIHPYLRSLPQDCDIFAMKTFLMSVVDTASPNYANRKLVRPTGCTTFVRRNGYANVSNPHVFYRAANFVRTEVGNHGGVSTTNRRHYCPDIAYIHYHDTGRQRLYERCRTILLGYGYITEGMTREQEWHALRTNTDGYGVHRQQQYLHYLESPDAFFREDPMPADTFHFEGVKQIVYTE